MALTSPAKFLYCSFFQHIIKRKLVYRQTVVNFRGFEVSVIDGPIFTSLLILMPEPVGSKQAAVQEAAKQLQPTDPGFIIALQKETINMLKLLNENYRLQLSNNEY